jgi:hypothetical protein
MRANPGGNLGILLGGTSSRLRVRLDKIHEASFDVLPIRRQIHGGDANAVALDPHALVHIVCSRRV